MHELLSLCETQLRAESVKSARKYFSNGRQGEIPLNAVTQAALFVAAPANEMFFRFGERGQIKAQVRIRIQYRVRDLGQARPIATAMAVKDRMVTSCCAALKLRSGWNVWSAQGKTSRSRAALLPTSGIAGNSSTWWPCRLNRCSASARAPKSTHRRYTSPPIATGVLATLNLDRAQ